MLQIFVFSLTVATDTFIISRNDFLVPTNTKRGPQGEKTELPGRPATPPTPPRNCKGLKHTFFIKAERDAYFPEERNDKSAWYYCKWQPCPHRYEQPTWSPDNQAGTRVPQPTDEHSQRHKSQTKDERDKGREERRKQVAEQYKGTLAEKERQQEEARKEAEAKAAEEKEALERDTRLAEELARKLKLTESEQQETKEPQGKEVKPTKTRPQSIKGTRPGSPYPKTKPGSSLPITRVPSQKPEAPAPITRISSQAASIPEIIPPAPEPKPIIPKPITQAPPPGTQEEDMGSIAPDLTAEKLDAKINVKDYNGKRKNFQSFADAVNLYFDFHDAQYKDKDKKKITLILSKLTEGEAELWRRTFMQTEGYKKGDMKYADFWTKFAGAFKKENEADQALFDLHSLKQGTDESAETTMTEFRNLASLAGLSLTENHRVAIDYLKNVLKPALVNKVEDRIDEPETFEEWVKTVIKHDNVSRRNQAMKRGLGRQTNGRFLHMVPTKKPARDPNAMDVDALTTEERKELLQKRASALISVLPLYRSPYLPLSLAHLRHEPSVGAESSAGRKGGARLETRIPGLRDMSALPEDIQECSRLVGEAFQKLQEVIYISSDDDSEYEGEDETPPLTLGKDVETFSDTQHDTFVFFDARGQPHPVKPKFHCESDYVKFKRIFEALRADRPKLIERFENSDFQRMGSAQVQKLFQQWNVAIPDYPEPNQPSTFDLNGLQYLAHLNHQTFIQGRAHVPSSCINPVLTLYEDQSLPIIDGDWSKSRSRMGSLQDLYLASIAPPSQSKSLNGLYFLNGHAGVSPSTYASDIYAVKRTAGMKMTLRFADLPLKDLAWWLAATKGAHSYWHFDSRGDGTWIFVAVGWKVWIVAEPIDPSYLSSSEAWTGEVDISDIDLTKWNLDAILLTPGTRFYMRPGTLHAVYTAEHSICSGGHFLPTSCLWRTVVGYIHSFMEEEILTNIDHVSIRSRLNAIASFFFKVYILGDFHGLDEGHLPDVTTREGLMNLIIFACGIEIQHAVCSDAYRTTSDSSIIAGIKARGLAEEDDLGEALGLYDISKVSHQMRLETMYARARIHLVVKAVLENTSIMDTDGIPRDSWNHIFVPTLTRLLYGCLDYFERSNGGKDCSDTHFFRQLTWVGMRYPEVFDLFQDWQAAEGGACRDDLPPFNIIFPMPEFTIVRPAKPPMLGEQELEHGMTIGDSFYFEAYSFFTSPDARHPSLSKLDSVKGRKRSHSTVASDKGSVQDSLTMPEFTIDEALGNPKRRNTQRK
ncbi:hypothetical protein NMY22_g993 [Coprinellus aureogranulatus]|nr:hypothetical protein NMY22_g993 [Coprinellus aureogranulatus]